MPKRNRRRVRRVPNQPGTQKQVSVAAAYSTGQSSFAPKIQASRDMARIQHRELISSINGTTGFSILASNSFSLNPGLSSTFPWLSTQALGWEQYRFNSLRFCYYTRTGSATAGSVMITPDYDAADTAPISEQIASAYEDTVEDVPWKDLECALRVDAMFPSGPKKFIRVAPLAANLDIKTYDAGSVFVATTDGAAVAWGKLWVEYDVTLFTPQLPSSGAPIGFQSIKGAVPTTALLVGAAPVAVANSSNFVTVVGEVLTFNQAGEFMVIYVATSTTITQTGVPVAANGGVLDTIYGPAGLGLANGGSGSASFITIAVIDAVVGATLTFNNTVVNGLLSELSIIPVPQSFN